MATQTTWTKDEAMAGLTAFVSSSMPETAWKYGLIWSNLIRLNGGNNADVHKALTQVTNSKGKAISWANKVATMSEKFIRSAMTDEEAFFARAAGTVHEAFEYVKGLINSHMDALGVTSGDEYYKVIHFPEPCDASKAAIEAFHEAKDAAAKKREAAKEAKEAEAAAAKAPAEGASLITLNTLRGVTLSIEGMSAETYAEFRAWFIAHDEALSRAVPAVTEAEPADGQPQTVATFNAADVMDDGEIARQAA